MFFGLRDFNPFRVFRVQGFWGSRCSGLLGFKVFRVFRWTSGFGVLEV